MYIGTRYQTAPRPAKSSEPRNISTAEAGVKLLITTNRL